jgi:preprotein translocase subunit SecE
MAKNSPMEFFRQVRQETSKVTWPSRKETTITTSMVFVMVAVASVFFLAVDALLSWGITGVLGLGS